MGQHYYPQITGKKDEAKKQWGSTKDKRSGALKETHTFPPREAIQILAKSFFLPPFQHLKIGAEQAI